MEIGSYFRDASDYQRARQFTKLARAMLQREPRSTRIRTLLARLWQHDGIAAIIEGNLELADECFKRARDEITFDYALGHANEALYEAQILLRSRPPRFDRIPELLKRYSEETDPLLLSRWTDLELRISEAQAAYQQNDTRGREHAFTDIRQLLQKIAKDHIVPTQAIFASSLFAFADEYPSHKIEIQGLVRQLTPEFIRLASTLRTKMEKITKQS
jgi:hypothetical protein